MQPNIRNKEPVKNPTYSISLGRVSIPTPIVILTQKITTPLIEPLAIGLKILAKKSIPLILDNFLI